jgi:hypothetical protein
VRCDFEAGWYHLATARMEFFEKYRLQDVGTTRARLAELITIFESERQTMTIRELEDLRAEIDELTEKLRVERDGV